MEENNTISIKIETETKDLDRTVEKVKELVSLLERANQLIQSLGNTTINNYSA